MKFTDEQLSRVLSHVGEMPRSGIYGSTGPGCLAQTALIIDQLDITQLEEVAYWFDSKGYMIKSPDALLRALESRGLA